jgi:hypothetical protein
LFFLFISLGNNLTAVVAIMIFRCRSFTPVKLLSAKPLGLLPKMEALDKRVQVQAQRRFRHIASPLGEMGRSKSPMKVELLSSKKRPFFTKISSIFAQNAVGVPGKEAQAREISPGKSTMTLEEVEVPFTWNSSKAFRRGVAFDPDFKCTIKTSLGLLALQGLGEDEYGGIQGQGGFGRVCTGSLEGEDVAVKFIRVFSENREAVEREVSFLLNLQGAKHVMGAKEVVYITQGDSGEVVYVAIVMNRADGNYFDCRGRLSLHEKAEVLLGGARGILELHNKGLVHRDIKPDNILLKMSGDQVGAVWVADLGLTVEEEAITSEGAMGTCGYMAPEVMTLYKAQKESGLLEDSVRPGKSSDIYSMGLSIFSVLANQNGEKRLKKSQENFLLELVFTATKEDFLHLPSPLQKKLHSLINDCLKKDPIDRISSQELVDRLMDCKEEVL